VLQEQGAQQGFAAAPHGQHRAPAPRGWPPRRRRRVPAPPPPVCPAGAASRSWRPLHRIRQAAGWPWTPPPGGSPRRTAEPRASRGLLHAGQGHRGLQQPFHAHPQGLVHGQGQAAVTQLHQQVRGLFQPAAAAPRCFPQGASPRCPGPVATPENWRLPVPQAAGAETTRGPRAGLQGAPQQAAFDGVQNQQLRQGLAQAVRGTRADQLLQGGGTLADALLAVQVKQRHGLARGAAPEVLAAAAQGAHFRQPHTEGQSAVVVVDQGADPAPASPARPRSRRQCGGAPLLALGEGGQAIQDLTQTAPRVTGQQVQQVQIEGGIGGFEPQGNPRRPRCPKARYRGGRPPAGIPAHGPRWGPPPRGWSPPPAGAGGFLLRPLPAGSVPAAGDGRRCAGQHQGAALAELMDEALELAGRLPLPASSARGPLGHLGQVQQVQGRSC
jgi:hypothetical protein